MVKVIGTESTRKIAVDPSKKFADGSDLDLGQCTAKQPKVYGLTPREEEQSFHAAGRQYLKRHPDTIAAAAAKIYAEQQKHGNAPLSREAKASILCGAHNSNLSNDVGSVMDMYPSVRGQKGITADARMLLEALRQYEEEMRRKKR